MLDVLILPLSIISIFNTKYSLYQPFTNRIVPDEADCSFPDKSVRKMGKINSDTSYFSWLLLLLLLFFLFFFFYGKKEKHAASRLFSVA